MNWPRYSVGELDSYREWASGVLSQTEQDEIVDILSVNPKAGALVVGTGGARKLRYGPAGRGKSGGVRVIYYFHSERMPLYIMRGYAKNEQANLSKAECNELRVAIERLVAFHKPTDEKG
jgi:mRNA-degrading endonuclease RelE of RelBE toxin-antitoxin system